MQEIKEEKRYLDNVLGELPDFMVELHCEFESNYIPFVDKMAPSDTIRIWKYGRCVRLDTSFNGLEGLKSTKVNRSIILNSLDETQKQSDPFDFFLILNRDTNQYFYPLVIP